MEIEFAQPSTQVDDAEFSTKQRYRGGKKRTALLVASVLLVVFVAIALMLRPPGETQRGTSRIGETEEIEEVPSIVLETTSIPVPETSTTTVPRTTTTFTGRSYCNADGIAELLGAGGFEDVPARSWEKYGLFTDDRRIQYSADGLWALAYTRYGSAPVALPRPWPTDSTPMGWLNCQSGRWVYVANAATFIPLCAAMDPEFQAAHLELLGSACL
jgi:hypothetical protein